MNREDGVPFWRQLYQQISQWIHQGVLTEGIALPSERDLAVALGVSRITIKRCYDELRGSRHLAGRGRGGSKIQVPTQVNPALGKLKGFTQEMQELGMTASSHLEVRQVVSDRAMSSLFNRPSNASFLHLVRIRKGDGTPMTREVAWYDLTLAPQLENWDGQGSVYAFLQHQCGLTLAGAKQSVEAVTSSDVETKVFGFESPQPCLLFKRKTHAVQGQLVEYVEGTFRGDAYVYHFNLDP